MDKTILMRLIGIIPWVKRPKEISFEVDGQKVVCAVNKWIDGADYGFDMGATYSPLIKRLPPKKRIWIATEPSPFMGFDGAKEDTMAQYYQGFLLSWHKQLAKYPQYRRFNAAIPWVKAGSPEPRKFGISGFVSRKDNPHLPGYKIRHGILRRESEIKIPSIVWNYRKTWQGKPHKYPVATSAGHEHMFHIAIENCSEDGYFTEKILDCFLSFNVPLYFGDPGIGKKFNVNGIIHINKDPIAQINSLTKRCYEDRMDAMKDNYARAKRYICTEKLISEEIIKLTRG